jgi:hypothetical protein
MLPVPPAAAAIPPDVPVAPAVPPDIPSAPAAAPDQPPALAAEPPAVTVATADSPLYTPPEAAEARRDDLGRHRLGSTLPFQFQVPLTGGPPALAVPIGGGASPLL